MLIAFILWSIIAAVFLAAGIYCRRTRKPVGFYTHAEPPAVKDAAPYNKAVASLWFVSAAVF